MARFVSTWQPRGGIVVVRKHGDHDQSLHGNWAHGYVSGKGGESLYYTKVTAEGGRTVGEARFQRVRGKWYVNGIEVEDDFRRHGAAQRMVEKFHEDHPDEVLHHGSFSSKAGVRFAEAMVEEAPDWNVIANQLGPNHENRSSWFRKDFNPDQPRDEAGRWTSGGVAVAGGIAPSPEFARHAERHLETMLNMKATDEGLDVEEVKAALTANTRAWLDDKRPCVRVPADVLSEILDDGRFKSQFETGDSGGTFAPVARAEAEEDLFGLALDSPDVERPIYGYVGDLMGNDGDSAQYGDVRVVLKADVIDRTTISYEDSLGMQMQGIGVPEMWNEATWRQAIVRAPSSTPSARWDSRSAPLLDASPQSAEDYRYVEAQIHGGVSVSDIEEVIFDGPPRARESMRDGTVAAGPYADEVREVVEAFRQDTKRLDELGVIWSVRA